MCPEYSGLPAPGVAKRTERKFGALTTHPIEEVGIRLLHRDVQHRDVTAVRRPDGGSRVTHAPERGKTARIGEEERPLMGRIGLNKHIVSVSLRSAVARRLERHEATVW